MLLQLLIFNTPWKELRVESRVRHSVLREKLTEQLFRYFQEPIL